MMRFKNLPGIIVFITIVSLTMAGCAKSVTPSPEINSEPARIRVAALPVLDTLPMYVAEKEGLFEKNGVTVEFIQAGSAPKRDELINASQADTMINEIVSTLFYNKEIPRVEIVRYARTATNESPIFRILAAGNSEIDSVEDLKGVEIGISKGTVIEYLTDRLLQKEGFSPEEIQTIAVPDIGQRMALLSNGELKASMLPDPLSSLAVQQGARVILDDTLSPEISNSVYSFRKEFADQNPDAVRGFLAAIEEAVAMINANPTGYTDLLSEQKLVPEPLMASFQLPKFVTAGVPTQAQWDDVLTWAKEKGLIDVDVSYADSVNPDYLP